ncbi:hypothetical protein PG996_014772 [Apiospora saccharicola]|uniref:Uncharacterized protein n=1 Tax=Apiospora saccharicola TaxID=335842 RepID=A0ABR1TJ93_9PEZI
MLLSPLSPYCTSNFGGRFARFEEYRSSECPDLRCTLTNVSLAPVDTARNDIAGLQTVTAVVRFPCPGPDRSNHFYPYYVLRNDRTCNKNENSIEHSNISKHLKIDNVVERKLLKSAGFFEYPPSHTTAGRSQPSRAGAYHQFDDQLSLSF